MNPERFARLKEIVLTIVRLPEDEREAYLAEACGNDESLRAEARSLLAQDGRDSKLVRTGSVRSLLDTLAEARDRPPRGRIPERIGPYRIVGVLGEGGMGVVFHAKQVEPISRDVALKLVSQGYDSESSRARFEAERQVLALMDHPSIARVLDAGSDEGRPYFVMELVRGVPITQYCRESGLGVRGRLGLFAEVCRAVRHAHQKGVIHRDLKPSNVLVTMAQDRAQVKVIDFGIAKAIGDTSLGARAERTRTGQLVGTIEYMSPEQARGEVSSIDVRSDVFSLGVIAYELVTDRLPWDLAGQPLHEIVRRICEEPEPRLRGSTTGTGRIDADVETIVGKCLAKDPERRYGSAAELAADVERYLGDRPVMARPASTTYQLRLFARRHKALVGAVATVIVVLLGASVVSTGMYLRAEGARVEAGHQRDAAQAVTDFLTSMLGSVAPAQARGREITVREILDKAATAVDASLAGQDEAKASVRLALGSTYRSLGQLGKAEEQLLATLELRRRLYGNDHLDTLWALSQLVFLKWYQGHFEEAERMQRELVETLRRSFGPEDQKTFVSQNQLGMILRDAGKNEEGVRLFRELVELGRRTRGPDDEGTLMAQYHLATLFEKLGFVSEAEQLHRQTLEARRRTLGEDHPDTMWSMVLLGYALSRDGRAAEAEPIVERACILQNRVLGKDHPDTLWCRNVQGETWHALGKTREAQNLFEQDLETRRRALGTDHRDTLWTMTNLAKVYSDVGRHADAEALAGQTLDTRLRLLGEGHVDVSWSRGILARIVGAAGRLEEMERLLRQNVAMRESNFPAQHRGYQEAVDGLSVALRKQGKYGEAEQLLLEVHRRIADATEVPADTRRRAVESIVRFYEDWDEAHPGQGHDRQSSEWRAKRDQAP